MDQEEVRQFSDQALNLPSISPAAAFEVTHPCAELVIAAILRTQDVAFESIPQQVLLRRKVEDFVALPSRPPRTVRMRLKVANHFLNDRLRPPVPS